MVPYRCLHSSMAAKKPLRFAFVADCGRFARPCARKKVSRIDALRIKPDDSTNRCYSPFKTMYSPSGPGQAQYTNMHRAQDFRLRSRTKIVATVGPATSQPERLADLLRAGVDVFRLNMAHGGPDVQQAHVDNLHALSRAIDEPIAILVDLAGPKIRLGELPDDRIFCELGTEFVFVPGDAKAPNELTSTYPPLVRELQVGDRVMLADGTVAM